MGRNMDGPNLREQDSSDEALMDGSTARHRPTRRSVVRAGVKLAFVAPVVSTFFASQAYAVNYSCYPAGHLCDSGGSNAEPCCNGACLVGPEVCP